MTTTTDRLTRTAHTISNAALGLPRGIAWPGGVQVVYEQGRYIVCAATQYGLILGTTGRQAAAALARIKANDI